MTTSGDNPVAASPAPAEAAASGDIVVCDACPVLCRIREGRTGACSRYGNVGGQLARMDPMVLAQQVIDEKGELVSFLGKDGGGGTDWDGSLIAGAPTFVTGIGSGTT